MSKRMIVTLSEDDKRWLEAYSRANRISIAEAIREGVGRLKRKEAVNTYRSLVQGTDGLWRKGDGIEYQRRLRAEWDSR